MRFFSTWIVCISFLLPGFAAEFKVGQSWNESVASRDPLSGLEIRQLTTKGIYNQGPTIHKDTAFPGGERRGDFCRFPGKRHLADERESEKRHSDNT